MGSSRKKSKTLHARVRIACSMIPNTRENHLRLIPAGAYLVPALVTIVESGRPKLLLTLPSWPRCCCSRHLAKKTRAAVTSTSCERRETRVLVKVDARCPCP